MNESWADFSAHGTLSASAELTPFFHFLKNDAHAVTGNVVVPVFGSGTCCSEFEALTGASYLFNLMTSPYAAYS